MLVEILLSISMLSGSFLIGASTFDIIEANAPNADARNLYSVIPLHGATISGNAELVRTLIERNADINTRNCHGITLLHYAAIKGNTEIAKLLIENRAEINAQDLFNMIPLHYAMTNILTQHFNIRTVALLILHGADKDIANIADETPENMLQSQLYNQNITNKKSRLDKKDLSQEALHALMQDIVNNSEDSTGKERLQTIAAMLKKPNLALALLGHHSTKNAQKR